MAEVPLPGGNTTGAVLIDGVIHKRASPWTPTVHALLRYLEEAGFPGAPRALGFDSSGREVLSYLPLFTIQGLGFDKIGAGLLVAASQAGGAVSRLALGAASDRWAAGRRSRWLAFTGAIGAAIFLVYAVWPAS